MGGFLNMMVREGFFEEVTFESRFGKIRWSWTCKEMGKVWFS